MQQEKCSMEKNISSKKKNGSTIYATEPSVKDTGSIRVLAPYLFHTRTRI